MDRREFLSHAPAAGLGLAAGLTLLRNPSSVRGAPASERLSVAVVGIRSRGQTLATAFAQRPDCRVTYLCDADTSLFATRSESIVKIQGGRPPACVQDFRKALDDKSVDVLVVATPDHWHCLATIWACEAGKDVYVAAPFSHNPWEGRKAVEAARRNHRIVQADLAARSAAYCLSAKKYIIDGKLGRVHLCRVYGQKGQSNFEVKPDSPAPAGLDWNAWNGPAPLSPYNVNYQNNWHGYWRYSGGDIAVDGIHQLDLARWLCDVDSPASVYAAGGRFDAPGGNETPDTLTAVFEFDRLLMNYESTLYTPYMQKASSAVRAGEMFPYWPQSSNRVEIYGSEGMMLIGPHSTGWEVFGRPRREQPTIVERVYGRPIDPDHQGEFVAAVRDRKLPSADVAEAHRSSLLVHYANMSLRTGGQKLRIDPKTEQVIDNPAAMKFFEGSYRKPWVVE